MTGSGEWHREAAGAAADIHYVEHRPARTGCPVEFASQHLPDDGGASARAVHQRSVTRAPGQYAPRWPSTAPTVFQRMLTSTASDQFST